MKIKKERNLNTIRNMVTCKCGAVLETVPQERRVKDFHHPGGVMKIVDEVKQHHCPTFDFGSGLRKETRNDNPRIG